MNQGVRHVILLACVCLTVVASSKFITAQVLRERELKPEYGFGFVEMPVELVSIQLKGKQIQPGEKIMGDDDWLHGLAFTVKNVSDKPIAYVSIALKFLRPDGFLIYSLAYGVDFSRGAARTSSSPRVIAPGETFDSVLTGDNYKSFLFVLEQSKTERNFDLASYFISRVCFENEPDIIWEGGFLKRRDPNNVNNFKILERYMLPVKHK